MKIIWTIDAFEDNYELNHKMAECLTELHQATRAEIQPVYLLRENELMMPTYEHPLWLSDHLEVTEVRLQQVLNEYNLPFLSPAHVIPHAVPSQAGAAEILARYAEEEKADLIVVGTHARQGLQRFLEGSFTTSLLTESAVPLLVVSNQTLHVGRFKNILFPTEFGEHAKENFRRVLNFARAFDAEVLLFHIISRPIENIFALDAHPATYNYEGRMLTIEQIVEHELDHQTRKAEAWMQWAAHEGVRAHYHIDASFKPFDDLIIGALREHNIDLVMLEARSSNVSAFFLGSATRNVIRRAHCPVFVFPKELYSQHPELTHHPVPPLGP